MAYITKSEVQEKAAKIKAIVKKYGCKVSIKGSNSSTISVRFTEGTVDFWENSQKTLESGNIPFDPANNAHYRNLGVKSINHYYIDESFSGDVLKMLQEVRAVLFENHWDLSDIQTDYFSCAYYVEMKVGEWNKPYKLIK